MAKVHVWTKDPRNPQAGRKVIITVADTDMELNKPDMLMALAREVYAQRQVPMADIIGYRYNKK